MNRVEHIQKVCHGTRLTELITAAAGAAMEAGQIIRSLYGTDLRIERKGAIDLVTEADRAAEAAIVKLLGKKIANIAFMAEESAASYNHVPEGPIWIIDPLDGTTNFAHGFPWFGVSIACWHAGRSLAGVIYCPMQDELFWAGEGCGAWLNNAPISVSRQSRLDSSLLATGFPYDVHENVRQVLDPLGRMLGAAQGVRRAGAAALDLAYVACGRLDGFWEIKLKPWDSAAGYLLVKEAGGKVTDFKGGDATPFVPELLASNGRVHQDMVDVLREFSLPAERSEK